MREFDEINIAGFVGFLAIAAMTWFFSSRRRLFIKFFCNQENYRQAYRQMPSARKFRFALRFFAVLEVIIALLILLALP